MSQENNLRQKAVNLFYLIFLILIFSFIPSGFVDTTYHTNASLDLISAEVNQLNNTSTKYFLHLLRNEPELLMQTKDKLIRIESITKNTTSYIDELKLKLIEVDKMDDFGYFKYGKEEGTSNSVMIYGKQADSLFNKLQAYKKTVAEYLTPKDVEEINKILPLPTYELTSDGNYVLAAEYYFQRTPLSVAVLNLSHFKSRVERIKVYAHQKIVKQILFENASILPFENMKLAKDETFTDILGTSSLQEFFETIEPNGFLTNQKAAGNELRSRYYIESLTDTIHPMGKAIQYYAYFDTTGTRSLKIQVSSEDGTQYFGLSKPGSFYFYPSSKGRYTFTFNNGKKITTKKITVIDADPIIQNTRLSTLYIGLDNPLNIKTSEFDANDNLTAEITDGQVIRKGEIFYARVFSKGITKIKIYAQMPYGRIKVAEKSFVIRELHKPIPSINGIISGGIVKKANISQFKVMTLQTDEYLIDEEVYIADFEFMLLYNKFSAVVQPIKNVGSSFNDQVLKGLQRAKLGDVIIFTNIRTLSSRGVETIIPTLTLNVI
ncbi:MAG: hypothetical protein ACI8ZQ_001178 [Bacteroidia bacterium]|jgi:hypothetical protein